MKIHTLQKEQIISQPLSTVFSFFDQPENLSLLTPKSMRFIILTPSPIQMKTGAEIDYRIWLMGIPLKWKTLITLYEPPFRFVDEQVKGPYQYWHHLHTFKDLGGRTLMQDEVRYALPYGPLGEMAHCLWVKRQLNTIFDFRYKKIEELFRKKKK